MFMALSQCCFAAHVLQNSLFLFKSKPDQSEEILCHFGWTFHCACMKSAEYTTSPQRWQSCTPDQLGGIIRAGSKRQAPVQFYDLSILVNFNIVIPNIQDFIFLASFILTVFRTFNTLIGFFLFSFIVIFFISCGRLRWLSDSFFDHT